jgi:dTDP-4-dehydrorhamnose 3,5-epimerase
MPIAGVKLADLLLHSDDRGSLCEVFRANWLPAELVQWNFVRTAATVLRGVHCHVRHTDYLLVLEGKTIVGLSDVRQGCSTEGEAELIELRGDNPQSLSIPPGVAHGFYFEEPTLHIYGVTEYWSPDDELGCRWDDAALGIRWPFQDALLSPRDAALPSLSILRAQINAQLANSGSRFG